MCDVNFERTEIDRLRLFGAIKKLIDEDAKSPNVTLYCKLGLVMQRFRRHPSDWNLQGLYAF